ncbi:hypothetical protein GJQ57_13580 [Ralstonia pickettii]|uniref:Uncharacterized protein n=1 Tax=Ralstonia pickettii TaxID=329 RepID=A0A7X2HNH2_RALPI|nr:hypothetical protein [Ralstonia pickettii]MRS99676.1 hypothetical protein [Ralstonia pickettii]
MGALFPAGTRPSVRQLCMALGAAALLAGCAVNPNGRGGVQFGVDTTELFGTVVDTFKLQDGSDGTLRKDSGGYSLKLARYMRVIPLQNALTAKVARVDNIGDRTVLTIETQERNCPYKYVLLAVQGSDVLHWEFGNCKDRPRANLDTRNNALTFDMPGYGRLVRYTYADSRMLQSAVPVPPGTDLNAKPFADASLRAPESSAGNAPAGDGNRYVPGLPQTTAGTSAPTTSTPTSSTVNPASTSTVSTSHRKRGGSNTGTPPIARGPAPMSFPAEELKPVRVDLLK